MSLRTSIRVAALGLGLILFSPLLWRVAGAWPPVAGAILLTGWLVCLVLSTNRPPVSRWQIRYHTEMHQANDRLDAVLSFLAERAGHVVLEANAQGLFLEAPAAFDRYVRIQLEQALPEARLSRVGNNGHHAGREDNLYLCLDPAAGDPLAWATQQASRAVRLHIHRGPFFTLMAQADAAPPGTWVQIPSPKLLTQRLWPKLPVWDELSGAIRPGYLLPVSGDRAVFSSRSHLLDLSPPDGYRADGDRQLGQAADGQALSLPRSTPLIAACAPSRFLVDQVLGDLAAGWATVVVSPQRRVLNLIQREAQVLTYWLDQENANGSAHLAVVGAGQWAGVEGLQPQAVDAAIALVETFLSDLGLDLHLPAVRELVRHLVRILAASARSTGHDLSFTDLYAIGQSTQTLRAFLADLADLVPILEAEAQQSVAYLSDQLEGDAGYVQIVTVLSVLRAVLRPLRSGATHILCRPPFVDLGEFLGRSRLLLVPMTNEFREYDRFLAAVLDLALKGTLATGGETLRLALHLHDPHLYRVDGGRRWIEAMRHDPRLSLLLSTGDGNVAAQMFDTDHQAGHLVFRCPETLALRLAGDWRLSCPADLAELPAGTALARLPGLSAPITLHTGGDR